MSMGLCPTRASRAREPRYYHLVIIASQTSTDDHLFATATTITKMAIVERSNCIIYLFIYLSVYRYM